MAWNCSWKRNERKNRSPVNERMMLGQPKGYVHADLPYLDENLDRLLNATLKNACFRLDYQMSY